MKNRLRFSAALAAPFVLVSSPLHALPQGFTDVTDSLGLTFEHRTTQTLPGGFLDDDQLLFCFGCDTAPPPPGFPDDVNFMCPDSEIITSWFASGVATGDVDGDFFPEIFVVGGDLGTTALFKLQSDGTYLDIAGEAGVQIDGERVSGPVFADYDGDGDLDLFLGGVLFTRPRLFRNDGGSPPQFTDVFDQAFPGYAFPNTLGAAFGDYDLDGLLDIYMPHSMSPRGPLLGAGTIDDCPPFGGDNTTQHLWRNNGDGTFQDVSVQTGIAALYGPEGIFETDQTFSPNFEDIDMDGDLDLLVASDIGTSIILVNDLETGTFTETGAENRGHSSMGTAVGDYDNDGDFDWFVSQISDGPTFDGNRLWRNDGNGVFTDAASAAGVANGWWGWGSSFGDLNHDGWLDIFHVNGFGWDFPTQGDGFYLDRPALAFLANGDGETFTDAAAMLGLADTGNGRGCSLFDMDLDGDLDIAISNHNGPFKLFRNELNDDAFCEFRLRGLGANTESIGSRVHLRSVKPNEPGIQLRGIRAGCNYQSANTATAHFGVGDHQGPFDATVTWPEGHRSLRGGLSRGSLTVIVEPAKVGLITDDLTFSSDEPIVLQGESAGPGGVDLSGDLFWWRQGEGILDDTGSLLTEDAGTLSPGTYRMAVFTFGPPLTFKLFNLVIEG